MSKIKNVPLITPNLADVVVKPRDDYATLLSAHDVNGDGIVTVFAPGSRDGFSLSTDQAVVFAPGNGGSIDLNIISFDFSADVSTTSADATASAEAFSSLELFAPGNRGEIDAYVAAGAASTATDIEFGSSSTITTKATADAEAHASALIFIPGNSGEVDVDVNSAASATAISSSNNTNLLTNRIKEATAEADAEATSSLSLFATGNCGDLTYDQSVTVVASATATGLGRGTNDLSETTEAISQVDTLVYPQDFGFIA